MEPQHNSATQTSPPLNRPLFKTIRLQFGRQDGLDIEVPRATQSVYVPYIYIPKERHDVDNSEPLYGVVLPVIELRTQLYKITSDWDEGMEVFRPAL